MRKYVLYTIKVKSQCVHACSYQLTHYLYTYITNTIFKNEWMNYYYSYSCRPSNISKAAPAASTKASQIPQCEKPLIIILLFFISTKKLTLHIFRLLNGWFTDNSGVYICNGNIHWRPREIQKLPAALCAIIHFTAGYQVIMHQFLFFHLKH